MSHFRDSRPGNFYRQDERYERLPAHPNETPPFLRFPAKHGIALDLWSGEGATAHELLPPARLAWPVIRREVLVPAGAGLAETTTARNYRALVRPDTQEIMSIVTSHYTVAENSWVAEATEAFARRVNDQPPMVAAVGFGRDGERSMFVARVTGDAHGAVCLLAHNTHGSEGAIRFQLVEYDREIGTTYVLDNPDASMTFAHVGDLEDRLEHASSPRRADTFIERYLADTPPVWERLANRLWTPRHSNALVTALWGETPGLLVGNPETSEVQRVDHLSARHPGHHLPTLLEDVTDAANAYRIMCDWIDNYSDACERGDFTNDRDERLALGAGNKYKRDAWRWILNNV